MSEYVGTLSKEGGVDINMEPWSHIKGVYEIRNMVNGWCYVGGCNRASGGVRTRIHGHSSGLNNTNTQHGKEFLADWHHGHKFQVSLMAEYKIGSIIPLTTLEKKHLDKLRSNGIPTYNVKPPNARKISFTDKEAPQVEAKILSNCTGTDDPNKCWLWNGNIDSRGYGKMCRKGKNCLVHRLLYQLKHPDIDISGYHIRHGDNCPKHCCNPAHMKRGGHQQNANDSAIKYELRGRTYTCYELSQLDESHKDVTPEMIRMRIQNGYDVYRAMTQAPASNAGKAHLSHEQQELIVQRHKDKWTLKQIGTQVGCHPTTVSRILRNSNIHESQQAQKKRGIQWLRENPQATYNETRETFDIKRRTYNRWKKLV